MLVIRRRPGEVIVIGEDIEIEVLDASGSHAKLGIRAPREIPVLRKEILLVSQQNRASSTTVNPQALKRVLTAVQRNRSNNPSTLR